MSDDDFMRYFKQKRHSLDFTHLDLRSKSYSKKMNANSKKEPALEWKELNKRCHSVNWRMVKENVAKVDNLSHFN